mgnify:CR=1 FL=1|tara:strand:+ start:31 stop:549 length:519 start_codon:yes stop_codon:yes gene_type:complete
MKKYEAIIILNPNLSSKANGFIKDFEKLLKSNSFNISKSEDVGRRQLSYSINNHNKGHYLLFNIEGDASKIVEIENKIKYDESIIRHLFISVKEHSGQDSQLLLDSKNKKNDLEDSKEKKDLSKTDKDNSVEKIKSKSNEEIKKDSESVSESDDKVVDESSPQEEDKEDKDE